MAKEIKGSEILELLNQGKSRKEIAEHFGQTMQVMKEVVWSNPKFKNLKAKKQLDVSGVAFVDDTTTEQVTEAAAVETEETTTEQVPGDAEGYAANDVESPTSDNVPQEENTPATTTENSPWQ